MRDILETMTNFIPFLEPYPPWVKALVSGWFLLSAVMVVVLIFTRPEATMNQRDQQERSQTGPALNITVTGDNAVVSSNQSGGVTARNVIVIQTVTASGARLVLLDNPKQE